MPFFQQIIDAALKKDDVAFQGLLNEGACIDERENSEAFNTVAGTLARQGHIEDAMRLIYKFGASPGFVVYGLLQASFKDEAKKVATEFGIDINRFNLKQFIRFKDNTRSYYDWFINALDGQNPNYGRAESVNILAHAGYVQEINDSLKRRRESILDHAAHGGHIFLLEKEYSKEPELTQTIGYSFIGTQLVNIGFSALRFQTAALALHSFNFLKNEEFCKELVKEIKPLVDFEIKKIEIEARTVRRLMQECDLDYQQAIKVLPKINQLIEVYKITVKQAYVWLTEPRFRGWFRNTAFREKDNIPLAQEIKQKISSYVLGCSDKETASFHTNMKDISANLIPISNFSGLFSNKPGQTEKNNETDAAPRKKRRRHGS